MKMQHSLSNKIIWILSLILVASITIFESYTWGKYILIVVSFLILIIDVLKRRGVYLYNINAFQIFLMLMTIYTLLSSLWAINKIDSLTRAYTFFQILICMFILYNHYVRIENVSSLISIIKWGSYCISIYSIIYYGFNYIISMMVSGTRINNAYTNINTIGVLAAIGIIIQLDEILRKKRLSVGVIFCIPSFMMVIATQSRKALIILVGGILLTIVFHNIIEKKKSNIIKIILIIIIFLIALNLLSNLEIFNGINERMSGTMALISGKGQADSSSILRQKLINLGWSIFKEHPLVGVGIGCPHIIANQMLNFDAYLHNGFVEILAGGGIIGFILYYSSYIYIFYNLFKYRDVKDESYVLCVVLALIFLLRDCAAVSMYSKIMYFYFLILFMYIEILKKRKHSS